MAINLAEKYSKKVADAFYQNSVILGKTSREYKWDGVKSVNVYTIQTQAPGDYTRSGTSRYGTPTEVGDTVQTLSVTQDKSVALTVDKGNNKQQMMIKNAGKVVNLEMREQFIPLFDKYALSVFAKGAGQKSESDSSLTKNNIVDAISKAVTAFINKSVPLANSYCFIGATAYEKLVLAPEFLNLEKLGTKALGKGVVGKVRDLQIVPVPDDYMPAGTGSTKANFIVCHRRSVLAPTQIKDMKIHQDAPGISGALLEIRWLFDAFVLDAKKNGVYVSWTGTQTGE